MITFRAVVRKLAYRIWRFRVRHDLDRLSDCRMFGLDLVITKGVLHPRHFASSRLLAARIARLDLKDAKSVADIGTGSGVLGLIAARAGARVIGVDISPDARSCAFENVRRNQLEDRMQVALSNVFDDVPLPERFDLIVTNPPFYSRAPLTVEDHAFAAGASNDFFAKLARQVPQRLNHEGRLLMVSSSDIDFAPISDVFGEQALVGTIVEVRRGIFETLTIREFRAKG